MTDAKANKYYRRRKDMIEEIKAAVFYSDIPGDGRKPIQYNEGFYVVEDLLSHEMDLSKCRGANYLKDLIKELGTTKPSIYNRMDHGQIIYLPAGFYDYDGLIKYMSKNFIPWTEKRGRKKKES